VVTGRGMTLQRSRERLVRRLTDAGIGDRRVLDVLRQLPRHLFVDEALSSHAYDDAALPIDRGTEQVLPRLTRTNTGFRHEVLEPVTFVPLLGGIA
jgi:protein-L-isoaspartate O-methyltransferase